jgi:hypothetical protein
MNTTKTSVEASGASAKQRTLWATKRFLGEGVIHDLTDDLVLINKGQKVKTKGEEVYVIEVWSSDRKTLIGYAKSKA